MASTRYDAIVVGCGGMGSAAVSAFAKRGLTVLGLEQFTAAHDRGSSHGQTRIIRQAYLEHPDYVPLLKSAYALWEQLEHDCGKKLFHRVGLLELGPVEGEVVAGVLAAAREHHLDVESLSSAEVTERFPGLAVPEGLTAVFEPTAGYLRVEHCVEAQWGQARRYGAEFHTSERVRSWQTIGKGVRVETDKDCYDTGHLVITGGAWAGSLLTDFNVPFQVLRKHLHWYANPDTRLREESGCPAFLYEVPAGIFYGFPQIDSVGVKLAEHSGGEVISDPTNVAPDVDATDRARVDEFRRLCLPGVSADVRRHSVCMYTVSPDHHFVLDRHPLHPQVSFAAGMSGHGFKFAPVIGTALADLAIDSGTPLPVDFLGLARFS